MQKNRIIRPAVSSMIAGALVASTVIASALSAQARPPRPARDAARDEARGAMHDSQPPRQGRMRPGMQGMPGMQGRVMQGRGMPGSGMPGMAAGAREGSPASALLRAREGLGLTDEQVRRLQAIESSAVRQPNSDELRRARADLTEAMRGNGSIEAARSAMDRMNRLRTEQALAGLKARQDARNVLTPDQRSRADNLMRGARRNAMGNARGEARSAGRGAGRGAMLRRAPEARMRMRMRGPEVRPNPGMRGGFGGGTMRPGGMAPGLRRDMRPSVRPDMRPETMRRLPPGVPQDRRMMRVPPRERDGRMEPRNRRDR